MRWMSPESLERRRWSEKSDVWSFGVFCWEVLSDGKLPFSSVASDEGKKTIGNKHNTTNTLARESITALFIKYPKRVGNLIGTTDNCSFVATLPV